MSSLIRTPDQRLRVFVSSTLGELAPERAAARAAIERLRLTPVMFELGARPHPPRELYRAYLEQSHVFLGIYWQSYGWVAPGEAISGLEDEYRSAGDRPRLLYLKRPADGREARLAALVEEFARDARAAYKHFSTPSELASLVEDDLAVLLSETFEAATRPRPRDHDPANRVDRTVLPAPLTETVGRESDIDAVVTALRSGARLVTLTGPGGVGKTRVAIEVARSLGTDELDAVWFVPLASTTTSDEVARAIAERVGARTDGTGAVWGALAQQFRERRVVLVLDNVEQISDLAQPLVELLEQASGLQTLLTSRQALRVRGEHEHVVHPLPVPAPTDDVDRMEREPAVRLFVERAAATTGRFRLTEANAAAVAELVARIDGLPLAIELAAARTRVLSLDALLERLSSCLDVLATTAPDLPERQRTLRATIQWSHDLLTPAERQLFRRLSVFGGGWTLPAAERVCGDDRVDDLTEHFAALLDNSMVVGDRDEIGGEPRFRMLETVRAYAWERLVDAGEAEHTERRHLDWFRSVAEVAQPHLCGPGQRDWVRTMAPERANLRRAVSTAIATGDPAAVVDLAWNVVVLYFVLDEVAEVEGWLRAAERAGSDLDTVTVAKLHSLLALTRIHHGDYNDVHRPLLDAIAVFRSQAMPFETAVVLHQLGFVHYRVDGDMPRALAALDESSALFDAIGHDWGVGLVQAMLGTMFAASDDLERAEACQQRSLEHARRIDSDQQQAQALTQLAMIRVRQLRTDEGLRLLRDAAPKLRASRSRTDVGYALDALAGLLLIEGDAVGAAEALCVATAERERLGVRPWPTLDAHIDRLRTQLEDELGAARFIEIAERVATRDVFDALEALEVLDARRTG